MNIFSSLSWHFTVQWLVQHSINSTVLVTHNFSHCLILLSALFSRGQIFVDFKIGLIHWVLNSLSGNLFVQRINIDSMHNIVQQYSAGNWILVPSTNREYNENNIHEYYPCFSLFWIEIDQIQRAYNLILIPRYFNF